MRKLLLSSLAATTMVGSALAADLRPPPPYVPPAPVATWTGLYIGINGGGIWTNSRDFLATGTDFGAASGTIVTFRPEWSPAAAAASSHVVTINNRAQGLIGGTWGYNWQFGSFVVGTEADFDGVFGCRNDNNSNFGFFGGNNNNTCGGTAIGLAPAFTAGNTNFSVLSQHTIQRSLDWLWTSRVRAGFLVTPSFLIYGTGGVALGRVRVNSAIITSAEPTFGAGGPLSGISFFDDSRLKAGFAAGGGVEWQLGSFGLFTSPFFKDLSFKAEALYYDLGSSHLDQNVQLIFRGGTAGCVAGGCLATNTGIHTTWRNNGVIARAGINYHIHWFDAAPVVARY
jgi:outer membrane immunogenic protein